MHRGSSSRRGINRNLPAVLIDDLACVEQAPIAARNAAIGCLEAGIENAVRLFRSDATAIVSNRHLYNRLVAPRRNIDSAVSVNSANRIAQETGKDRTQQLWTAGKRWERTFQIELQLNLPFRDLLLMAKHDVCQQFIKISGF